MEKADSESDTEESCQTSDKNAMYNNMNTYNSSYESIEDNFNPVGWTYVISGAFTIVTGFIMIVLALLKAEENIKTLSLESDEGEQKEKQEEPIKDVIWLYVPILIFYFIIVSLELLYQSYIYSIALCSDLNFTVKTFFFFFF